MYIVIFILAITFFIMFHEYGHFATARAFGMKAERFFLGFGPTVWSFQRGETEYGVKGLPLGGFVKIAGMTPYEEFDNADRGKLFFEKPAWQRLVVLVAGSATHFVMAFLLLFAALAFVGLPTEAETTRTVQVLEPGAPADEAGIQTGDEIVAIDSDPVTDTEEIRDQLAGHEGQTVPVTVVRDGTEQDIDVTLTPGQEMSGEPVFLGVGFELITGDPQPLGVVEGFSETVSGDISLVNFTGLVLGGIADVLSPQGLASWFGSFGAEERAADGPVSLVGAGQIVAGLGEAGDVFAVLLMLVQLNIVLGALNLLPLPPLDGGHVLTLAIEQIVNGGRRLRGNTERWHLDPAKMTPLALVVLLFFGTIFIAALYLDIVSPASQLIQ